MAEMSVAGNPMKSWQPRSVFSITACLNLVAYTACRESISQRLNSLAKKVGSTRNALGVYYRSGEADLQVRLLVGAKIRIEKLALCLLSHIS